MPTALEKRSEVLLVETDGIWLGRYQQRLAENGLNSETQTNRENALALMESTQFRMVIVEASHGWENLFNAATSLNIPFLLVTSDPAALIEAHDRKIPFVNKSDINFDDHFSRATA